MSKMARHSNSRSWLATAAIFLSVAEAVTSPACQLSAAPQQNVLGNARTAYTSTPSNPLGIVYASQPNIAFVSFNNFANSTLGVLNTSTFPPTLISQVALPATFQGALGISLSHNGSFVFVAAGPGAVVVNASRAIAGSANAVVGTLNGTTATQMPGKSAFSLTLSLDDKYAFVAQEFGNGNPTPGNIDVFQLHTTPSGSVTGTPVGFQNLSYAVTGSTLSPDGKLAYATSETTNSSTAGPGILSTLNVSTLETSPGRAILTNATAGCGPVRSIVSSDGKTVWVTARESNHLLAFNASKLLSDPANALLASVQVGTSPVGLVFARNESRILTADSNRRGYSNTTGLSVVDVKAALNGSASSAVLGRIPTGLFPRNFAVSRDRNTILVTDYSSAQIQAVDVSTLP